MEQGIELNQQEIEDTIRLNLRGAVNCLLYHPKIEIFMGYDYYMYVKLDQNIPLDIISSTIKSEKLYWEVLENFDYFYEDIAENRFTLRKETFSTFFKLMFKGIFTDWITNNSITIQFDASYRLYLSFYGHKKEVQKLVEKHGLYWQERQPPYHKAIGFR